MIRPSSEDTEILSKVPCYNSPSFAVVNLILTSPDWRAIGLSQRNLFLVAATGQTLKGKNIYIKDLDVVFVTLEIGVLGHHKSDAVRALQLILPQIGKREVMKMLLALSKTAVSCSRRIFQARAIPCWNSSAPYYCS